MNFDAHFNIVSESPGFVTIRKRSAIPASKLTTAEARKMAAHLNRICDVMQDAESELNRRIDLNRAN